MNRKIARRARVGRVDAEEGSKPIGREGAHDDGLAGDVGVGADVRGGDASGTNESATVNNPLPSPKK